MPTRRPSRLSTTPNLVQECRRAARPSRAASSDPAVPRRPALPGVRMLTALRRFIRDESGEDLIEYGLLAAFVASVAFAVLILDPLSLQEGVKNAYNRAKSALSNA